MSELQTARLPQGPIHYRDEGTGPVIVFVHGLLVNGLLWRKVVPPLVAAGHRCIVPDWPLGAHAEALHDHADRSVPGQARTIADFLAALDLEDVTLVANDTGGALVQVLAARHPERIARIVLTTCDAYEVFPPRAFAPLLWASRIPGFMALLSRSLLRFPSLRQLPLAYGALSHARIPDAVTTAWLEPAARDGAVRRDLVELLAGIEPRWTLEAARALRDFEQPVLLLWSENPFFPESLAQRLADDLPHARVQHVEDAGVFVCEDQPERTAEAIARFVAGKEEIPARVPR